MIKQIQLRGITRNPSDRQTPDGGCAESINAYLDENETAPAPIPSDNISDSIYGNSQIKAPIKFIHKLPVGGEIYIGVKEDTEPVTFKIYAYKNGSMQTLNTLLEPSYFASIGNTLIIYAGNYPHYYLFKEGSYISLGARIPRPTVEIVSRYTPVAGGHYSFASEISGTLRNVTTDVIETWNSAKNIGNARHNDLLQTMEDMWGTVVKGIDQNRNDGIFVAPFFIRYALKLYDNSYIYQSTPILCGGFATTNWVEVKNYTGTDLTVKFNVHYKIRVKGEYDEDDMEDWRDLVKSIDFFASTPIQAPNMYATYSQMVENSTAYEIILHGMNPDEKAQTIKDEVLSKGQFYKFRSISLNDSAAMEALGSGEMIIENSPEISGDELVTHEVLEGGYRDEIQYLPVNGVSRYNNRLLLIGAKETIARGDVFLNGQCPVPNTGVASQLKISDYEFKYKLVNPINGEVNYVMAHYYRNDSPSILNSYFAIYDSGTSNEVEYLYHGDEEAPAPETEHTRHFQVSQSYAWLCYPDARCTEIHIKAHYWDSSYSSYFTKYCVMPLEPHPLLECAYAFWGFGKTLNSKCTLTESQYETQYGEWSRQENRQMVATNKLFLSKFENPFLFPAEGIISFNDEVVGVAATSVALSEGQFGDFDLYVFTKDGIRVLGVNSEGSFSTKVTPPNMARHIALHGTILGLDQSIVFTTERGVMLLTGSSIQCISNLMNGRHWILDDGLPNNDKLTTYINGWTGYSSVSAALSDNSTFMEFMKQAKVAYDYNGRRLLFCKDGVGYYYTYMLDTATWHKMISEETSRTILNSFPECLMASEASGVGVVYDYSTVLDSHSILSDTGNVRYSLIATRPLDLGEPDIRKAIKDLRVRGRYNDKTDVKYVLLGSMDGTNWNILRTLRGGSFKWFRIVLLCGLSPTERITWIDVDFETRFANRLR